MTIEYSAKHSREIVSLTDGVLDHFDRHRQRTLRSTEAGGQLFARFNSRKTIVDLATGPRKSDRRSRFTFFPNRYAERREIRRLFDAGLHYVGDWHTHPEHLPFPSRIDIESIQETVRSSRHELAAFVLVIVGIAPSPEGLYVSIARGNELQELSLVHSP